MSSIQATPMPHRVAAAAAIACLHLGAGLLIAAGLRGNIRITADLQDPIAFLKPPAPAPAVRPRPEPIGAILVEHQPLDPPDPRIPDFFPVDSGIHGPSGYGSVAAQPDPTGGSGAEQGARLRTGDARLQALIDGCYPAHARRRGQEGRGVARIVVAEDGRARIWNVDESTGFQALDPAMGCVARRLQFEPAHRDGLAVESTVLLPITFRLQ